MNFDGLLNTNFIEIVRQLSLNLDIMLKEWIALGETDRNNHAIMQRRYFKSMAFNLAEIFDLYYANFSAEIERIIYLNLQDLQGLIILFQASIYYAVALIYFIAGYLIMIELQPKMRNFYESIYILPYDLIEKNFNMIRVIREIKSGKLNLF